MDTSLAWVSYHMMGYMATGRVPGPMGSSLGAIAPYRAFPTSDGYVMIAAGNDAIFRRLCAALELAGVAADRRFRSNPERVANRAILDPIVEAATECMTTDDLLGRTREHSIPASAIQSIDQVVADPQVDVAGMFPRVDHPDLDGYRDVSLPLRMNGERPRAEGIPPAPGQHSVEILEELGLDEREIEGLFERGVINSGH